MEIVATLYPTFNLQDSKSLVQSAIDKGATMIEWRLDSLIKKDVLPSEIIDAGASLINASRLPVILTLRSVKEGGNCCWTIRQRLEIFKEISKVKRPRFVDVEFVDCRYILESLEFFKDSGIGIIGSFHDFKNTVFSRRSQILEMASVGLFSILKIAWIARSVRDVSEAIDLSFSAPLPTVAIPMGKIGWPARILAAKGKMPMMYFSLEKYLDDGPEAQVDLLSATTIFNIKSINKKTLVYGLVGRSIYDSPGYSYHNNYFKANKINACYIPLEIPTGMESLKAFLLSTLLDENLNFYGISVTMPHKKTLVGISRGLNFNVDIKAIASGSGNTITRKKEGWAIEDHDGSGLVQILEKKFPKGLRGLNALVFGSGGVGCSISAAFLSNGMNVFLLSRDKIKAMNECARLQKQFLNAKIESRAPSEFPEIFVNATPLGVSPDDQSPFEILESECNLEILSKPLVVECVISSNKTKLELFALENDCAIVTGNEFWKSQAKLQQNSWGFLGQ